MNIVASSPLPQPTLTLTIDRPLKGGQGAATCTSTGAMSTITMALNTQALYVGSAAVGSCVVDV